MSKSNGWTSVPCAFCHGQGVDPFAQMSSESVCAVCKGQKTVNVPTSHESCPACKGTGTYKSFYCMVCRGKGAVAKAAGATKVCPQCDGLALEASSGLPCSECRGLGHVFASHQPEGVHA